MKKNFISGIIWTVVILLLLWLSLTSRLFFRWDLTQEKRYTLSENTLTLLSNLNEPIEVTLYLNGTLDANMAQLRNAFLELIQEYNIYGNRQFNIVNINPSASSDESSRYAEYRALESEGLTGMTVSLQGNDGSLSQQIVFPWALFSSARDTVAVALIQPSSNRGAEQSIQSAIEDLEYQISDALRILERSSLTKVAFIEGHGELTEWETYDISDALSRYFQIDRGFLSDDPSILEPYAAIIIASPKEPFTEQDKYIIDQYIMRGGRVMWLIDGVQISDEELASSGVSPTMPLDINLSDMLFKYGVRLTPTIISDLQCTYMPINVSKAGENPRFEPMPFFYSPLLQGSPYHPITKNLTSVRATYPSGVELLSGDNMIQKSVLLITSNASHVTTAPDNIILNEVLTIDPKTYFTTGYVPIAVSLEGIFPSVFTHRMTPKGLAPTETKEMSVATRMVIVGDGDLIRNDFERDEGGYRLLPAGYDRITRQTYGNSDFALNSLLYLTDENGLMNLRNRRMTLRLLNKSKVLTHSSYWQAIAIGAPLVLLILLGVLFFSYRRYKYK